MKKILLSCAVALSCLVGSFANAAEQVTVFAAASMKDVIDEAAKQFKEKDGIDVVSSFASSSVLAKQIESGAPASIFISADLDWMDYVQERKLIDDVTRAVIAGNALVIATQKDKADSDVEKLLSARFAMGDPSNVPAGKYGKAALEHLKLWSKVESNAVFTENVRVALQYVSRDEVNAAIVYASDRAVVPELVEAYRFPADSHQPILYPAALVKGANAEAKAFLAFLESDAGQAIIAEKGFVKAAEAK
ncbi:molybdate ABC transporter substrate-binding protein [Brucellaceae bacterium C25G]